MQLKRAITFVVCLCMYTYAEYSPIFINDSLFEMIKNEDMHTTPLLPETYRRVCRSSLPTRVDNSERKQFRPVFKQGGGSCTIASQLGYHFTYLYNVANNSDASKEAHQFPTHYIWNYCNRTITFLNVSFDILRKMGTVKITDWGEIGGDESRWLSGYDYYYRAMHFRGSQRFHIFVESNEALSEAKGWLYNMNGRNDVGGLLSFSCDFRDYVETTFAAGSQKGKKCIEKFGTSGGHRMTIVGYDDSTCFDFNGDGKYTNDVDLNGDGEITLADREWGAYKAVNSWGEGYHNKGFFYVPYRLTAIPEGEEGGLHSRLTILTLPDTAVKVTAALEVTFSCENRQTLKIVRGISNLGDTTEPQIMDTIHLGKYAKGVPMTGSDSTITMGFDYSHLFGHDVITGQNVQLFLGILSDSVPGTMHTVKLHEYRQEDEIITDVQALPETFEIGTTWITVECVNPLVTKPLIKTDTLKSMPGIELTANLTIENGGTEYRCSFDSLLYDVGKPESIPPTSFDSYLDIFAVSDKPPFHRMAVAIATPFSIPYFGRMYDTLTFAESGAFWFRDPLMKATKWSALDNYPESSLELDRHPVVALTGPKLIYTGEKKEAFAFSLNDTSISLHFRCKVSRKPYYKGVVTFNATIHQDGVIDCFIDKDFSAPDSVLDREIVMGLSDGYGNYQHHPITTMQELKDSVGTTGYSFSYIPSSMPEVCAITPEGKLTLKSNKAGHWRIPVAVTNSRGVTVKKCIQFIVGETGLVEEVSSLDRAALSVAGRKLHLNGFRQGKAALSIYSLLGRKLYDKTVTITDGHTTLNLPNGVHQGVVLVEVSQGSHSVVRKIALD